VKAAGHVGAGDMFHEGIVVAHPIHAEALAHVGIEINIHLLPPFRICFEFRASDFEFNPALV
jgi:hypothetical protein